MAENEEVNETQVRQQEIKDNINPIIIEIKNLSDSFIALLEKKEFTEADLDNAFDINDAMQEQAQEINALLFELRDTIKE